MICRVNLFSHSTTAGVAFALSVATGVHAAAAAPEAGETPQTIAANVKVAPGTPKPPEVLAAAWMITDIESGKILASSNADTPHAPASTLKTLTALALLPAVELNDKHVVTYEEAAIEGSKVGIVEDSSYTIEDLMYGMMLSSGNDAAFALANEVGGMSKATGLMNAKLEQLGAENSAAENTSGLDAPGQVTTAYDMTLIARAALANEDLAEMMSTKQRPFPDEEPGEPGEDRGTFMIGNGNKLLYNYDGATGLKTGYTVASRHTFMGSAKRDDVHLVATILRSEGRAWKAAADLMDWGFEVAGTTDGIGALPDLADGDSEETVAETSRETQQTSAPSQAPREPSAPTSNTTGQYVIAGLLVLGACAGAVAVARGAASRKRKLGL